MRAGSLVALGLVIAGEAAAAPPAVTAAETWVKAMTDAKGALPSGPPLTYTIASELAPCAKLSTGIAATTAQRTAVKACFVATWAHVAKEAVLDMRALRSKDLDGAQLRYGKQAPKGTVWVRAEREYAGQALRITMAVGADRRVRAVWLGYVEHDGE